MAESAENNLHIALFPWLAFGHMLPFLYLAVALARAGHRVSFLSTARNIHRLRPKLPNNNTDLLSLITFVSLPLPRVDGLAEHDAEATTDIPPEQTHLLWAAYDLLRDPINQFLSESSPDWLVRDIAAPWAGATAREHGVQTLFFSVFHVPMLSFMGPSVSWTAEERRRCWPTPGSLTTKPEWVTFPSEVVFRSHETELMHLILTSEGPAMTEGCEAIAVRGCSEFGGEYLDLFTRVCPVPVIPVGLLPPPATTIPYSEQKENDSTWSAVFEWLDEQAARSVVFASFGSEYKISKSQVQEVALGLELSDLPFLWALRRPNWLSGDDDVNEALPDGFAGRTRGRGVVALGWAPQLEILAHPSIGGSLFHSGWGSVVETLRHGHVPVLLPFIFDQGLNARFLVEKGLGIEVGRGDEDGSFNAEEIARCLRTAMVSDKGEAARARAREAAAVFGDQALHDEYVKRFAEYLRDARNK